MAIQKHYKNGCLSEVGNDHYDYVFQNSKLFLDDKQLLTWDDMLRIPHDPGSLSIFYFLFFLLINPNSITI